MINLLKVINSFKTYLREIGFAGTAAERFFRVQRIGRDTTVWYTRYRTATDCQLVPDKYKTPRLFSEPHKKEIQA